MRDIGDGDVDDESAGIVGRGIRLGMHRVVVILGVRRIDGDEGHLPPVFAALESGGLRCVGFLLCLASEHGRDAVRMDGDQAHRPLAFERAEPLDHAAGRQAQTRGARGLDRDQIAILRVGGRTCGNGQLLAEHLLVDRFQAPAAVLGLAENSQHAVLRMIDDLDDAAAVTNSIVLLGLLDAQQDAIAEAGGFAGPRFARHVDADFRRGPVRFLVPFVRGGDEIAVAVARGNVGQHGRGQGAGMVQLLAPLLDRSFVGKLAQQALEIGAQRVLQAEGAGDFTRADFAGLVSDEGENVGLGGK